MMLATTQSRIIRNNNGSKSHVLLLIRVRQKGLCGQCEKQITQDHDIVSRGHSAANVQLVDIDHARQQLIETEFGSHFLLSIPELDTWRVLYPATVKKYFIDDNSIVLVIPFYETTQSVRQALAREIPMFEKYERNGSIAVIDSIKAYFSDIGIMTFVDGLLKHAKSLGKSGISVLQIWDNLHTCARCID